MRNNGKHPLRSDRLDARGFTLVELLVVIAIIAMMVTALMPAIQAARAGARQAQCKNNMLQLVLAIQNYEMANTYYPAGVRDSAPGPIQHAETGEHHSWTVTLLPYLDEFAIHRHIAMDKSVYDPQNDRIRKMSIPTLLCPSDNSSPTYPQSSYAACHHDIEAAIGAGNNGVFHLNSRHTIEDVRDGLSQTIFFGEKISDPDDLGWMSGTRSTLRNTGSGLNFDPWKPLTVVTKPPAAKPVPLYGDDYGGYVTEDSYDDEAELIDDDEVGDGDRDADPFAEPGEATANDVDSSQPGGNKEETKESDSQRRVKSAKQKVVRRVVPQKTPLSVGGFGSRHGGGAHISFGDGRIQFMSSAIDPQVFSQLGHRNDGKLLDPAEYRE